MFYLWTFYPFDKIEKKIGITHANPSALLRQIFTITHVIFYLHFNRGIKHDFPFINIRKVPREVLKTEGEARGFQPSRGTLRMLMNDKIMFDRYYCINSTKHCENEENIGALYFITSPHFPTRVRYAIFGPRSSTHNLARALRDAW